MWTGYARRRVSITAGLAGIAASESRVESISNFIDSISVSRIIVNG